MSGSSISLFRRIERALETIAHGSTPLETIRLAADFIVDNFAEDLGIRGGRIYAQDDGSYELVGGDFYDVITLDDRSFAVVVADATGHGLPAALQVRDIFTGLRMGLTREFKLTRTVERLNVIIHRSRLATKFVSLFIAEINHGGTVVYCNAGHPPAVLMRADGTADLLRSGGMILGPNPDATYSFGVDEIDPGDALVLFTDGITEANDEARSGEYGHDRLVRAIRAARHLDPLAIVDRVCADVDTVSAVSPPADDQTLVVVKRRAPKTEEIPA